MNWAEVYGDFGHWYSWGTPEFIAQMTLPQFLHYYKVIPTTAQKYAEFNSGPIVMAITQMLGARM